MALATPQIQGEELGRGVEQSVHSRPVAFGQIHDMDVIPDSCAIGRGPVPAINFQARFLPLGHQVDQGKEVAGLPEGGFADAAAGMGADGIEVTQPGHAPAGLTGR